MSLFRAQRFASDATVRAEVLDVSAEAAEVIVLHYQGSQEASTQWTMLLDLSSIIDSHFQPIHDPLLWVLVGCLIVLCKSFRFEATRTLVSLRMEAWPWCTGNRNLSLHRHKLVTFLSCTRIEKRTSLLTWAIPCSTSTVPEHQEVPQV